MNNDTHSKTLGYLLWIFGFTALTASTTASR
jgi:hypothetical protein